MTILPLPDTLATEQLARTLALRLGRGDVLLLEGPLGAGKTHFARALIQALMLVPEEVPSPTFTLVQVYDGPGFVIWHADLYRLSDPEEVVELGLTEAFDSALCLVEWPERLGPYRPPGSLTLRFAHAADDGRTVTLAPDGGDWTHRLAELA